MKSIVRFVASSITLQAKIIESVKSETLNLVSSMTAVIEDITDIVREVKTDSRVKEAMERLKLAEQPPEGIEEVAMKFNEAVKTLEKEFTQKKKRSKKTEEVADAN